MNTTAERMKHTAGPWGYEDPMGPELLTIVANPEAPVYDWIWVAQISTEPVDDDDGTIRDNRSFEEHEANARLIAAAPDLLVALKRCEAMVSTDQGAPNWDWVREVIAKAEASL